MNVIGTVSNQQVIGNTALRNTSSNMTSLLQPQPTNPLSTEVLTLLLDKIRELLSGLQASSNQASGSTPSGEIVDAFGGLSQNTPSSSILGGGASADSSRVFAPVAIPSLNSPSSAGSAFAPTAITSLDSPASTGGSSAFAPTAIPSLISPTSTGGSNAFTPIAIPSLDSPSSTGSSIAFPPIAIPSLLGNSTSLPSATASTPIGVPSLTSSSLSTLLSVQSSFSGDDKSSDNGNHFK